MVGSEFVASFAVGREIQSLDLVFLVDAQTDESVGGLRRQWNFWEALPTTSPEFVRIDDLDECVGALETLLLDKQNYMAMIGGDGACPGCGEKTVVHLFVSTMEALMQPRVKKHVERLDDLTDRYEKDLHLKLISHMDLSDTDAIDRVLGQSKDGDLTVSSLFTTLYNQSPSPSLDVTWLESSSQLLAQLKHLKWQYTTGLNKQGRSSLGMVNATGCTSVWGSTYPYNPYPFPWVSHLFQDAPSVAMGIFEGHMAKMAEGFKAIRIAELELEGKYDEEKDKEFFTYFDWQQFSEEEFLLCPPVVAVGGDGAMYDIGFQNLSRMMMSGKPIKALVLDTQVYSNTGGQACTSGFTGQISDMAQYGKAQKGKEESRKDIALIGAAHRTTYVAQGATSNPTHVIESFIQGLNMRRPALFNIYTPCQPEHGIADELSEQQSKLAVESRAYPAFRYNPEEGATPSERFDLEGNPGVDDLWQTYTLNYLTEEGANESMELPLTFADFALTEARFRKQFNTAPPESWDDDMVEIAEYIELEEDDREDITPFVWAVDAENHLIRAIPAAPVIEATEERRDFWLTLRETAGLSSLDGAADDAGGVDIVTLEEATRAQVVKDIAGGLKVLVTAGANGGSNGGDVTAGLASLLKGEMSAPKATEVAQVTEAVEVATTSSAQPSPPPAALAPESAAEPKAVAVEPAVDAAADTAGGGNGDAAGEFVAAWIDSIECTSCDECIDLNPKIFAYDDKKKAYVKDPKGGTFKDIVRAAEKCTAKIIHPGHPKDPTAKGVAKLIKRAKKFM